MWSLDRAIISLSNSAPHPHQSQFVAAYLVRIILARSRFRVARQPPPRTLPQSVDHDWPAALAIRNERQWIRLGPLHPRSNDKPVGFPRVRTTPVASCWSRNVGTLVRVLGLGKPAESRSNNCTASCAHSPQEQHKFAGSRSVEQREHVSTRVPDNAAPDLARPW